MALSPEALASGFDVSSVTDISSDAQVSMYDVVAIFNVPSDEVQSPTFDVAALTESPSVPAEVSQFDIIVIYRGRNDSPKIRAWTYTLDGHDYYVLRLGQNQTLVYDTLSQQWSVYGTGDGDPWQVSVGKNWQEGTRFFTTTSNVIVGDDARGVLYFLNPDKDDDDSANAGGDPRPFRRAITGQVVVKPGYNQVPCFGVHLFGSIGQTSETEVELEFSDDRGVSYINAGTVDLPANEFETRADWLSLGSMRAPGRMFRVTDRGSLKRIDALEMRDGNGG
jgi:hypothetical protein